MTCDRSSQSANLRIGTSTSTGWPFAIVLLGRQSLNVVHQRRNGGSLCHVRRHQHRALYLLPAIRLCANAMQGVRILETTPVSFRDLNRFLLLLASNGWDQRSYSSNSDWNMVEVVMIVDVAGTLSKKNTLAHNQPVVIDNILISYR